MPSIARGRSLADATALPLRAGDAIPQPAIARQLAEDMRNGRYGEVMPDPFPAHLLAPNAARIVRLRPVGGGREWDVPAEFVRLVAS